MSEIDHIGALSPNAVLAEALSDVEDIEHVLVYIARKDEGGSHVAWSRCELRDTAFAIHVIQRELNRTMDDD